MPENGAVRPLPAPGAQQSSPWPLLPLFISPIRSECWPFLLRVKIDSHSTEIFFLLFLHLFLFHFHYPPGPSLHITAVAAYHNCYSIDIPLVIRSIDSAASSMVWLISIFPSPSPSSTPQHFVNPTVLVPANWPDPSSFGYNNNKSEMPPQQFHPLHLISDNGQKLFR